MTLGKSLDSRHLAVILTSAIDFLHGLWQVTCAMSVLQTEEKFNLAPSGHGRGEGAA